jgi:hypothetical protein
MERKKEPIEIPNNEILEYVTDLFGSFFPLVAMCKTVYDFNKEQEAKFHIKKLYWFAKSARNGNIDSSEFAKFFVDNEDSYGEMLVVLNRLDTEEAVSDFVKILNKFVKGDINHELFLFFVYVITHWLLGDRDIMVNLWKDKGTSYDTADMKITKLICIDCDSDIKLMEPLKRLVAYGLMIENIKVEIDHNYDKRTSYGSEVKLKYTYIYQKNAMILCSIIGV